MSTRVIEDQIIDALRNGQSLTGKNGVLTPLIQRAGSVGLEGEMDSYLSAE